MDLVVVATPTNEAQLLALCGRLEAEEIPHMVRGDHFGSLFTGPLIHETNAKTLLVPPEYAERARAIAAQLGESG